MFAGVFALSGTVTGVFAIVAFRSSTVIFPMASAPSAITLPSRAASAMRSAFSWATAAAESAATFSSMGFTASATAAFTAAESAASCSSCVGFLPAASSAA